MCTPASYLTTVSSQVHADKAATDVADTEKDSDAESGKDDDDAGAHIGAIAEFAAPTHCAPLRKPARATRGKINPATWALENADVLAKLPAAPHPQNDLHGQKSWTLRHPVEAARINVIISGKKGAGCFYVKGAKDALGKAIDKYGGVSIAWGKDVDSAWLAALRVAGWE